MCVEEIRNIIFLFYLFRSFFASKSICFSLIAFGLQVALIINYRCKPSKYQTEQQKENFFFINIYLGLVSKKANLVEYWIVYF